MEAVERVRVQLLLPGSPWEWREPLLDTLERAWGGPSHWGEQEGLRNPYQRQALEEFVEAQRYGEAPPVPALLRTAPPRYMATLSTSEKSPGWLHIDSRMRLRPEDPALLFELAQHLANVLPVEYGLVDIQFRGAPAELLLNEGHLQHPGGYVRWGPDTLFARTFIGPRLARLMGEANLRNCGAELQRLDDGVFVLDLLPEPWRHEAAALKQQQQQVLSQLRRTGVFSHTEGGWTSAGERWEPPRGAQP